jgi:hypothetical protein
MYDRTNEPKCKSLDGHAYRPVGGNGENPGYQNRGEMLTYTEECRRCGLMKVKHIAAENTSKARMQEKTVYLWPGEPRKGY